MAQAELGSKGVGGRALRYIVTLLLVLWGSTALLHRLNLWLDPNEAKLEALAELRGQSFDVLYLGNSVVAQGINPEVVDRITGLESYNLALGGASIYEQTLLLEHYLSQNEAPAALVYGLSINRGAENEVPRAGTVALLGDEARRRHIRRFGAEGTIQARLAQRIRETRLFRARPVAEHLLKYLLEGRERVPRWVRGHLALEGWRAEPQHHPSHAAGINMQALQRLLVSCRNAGIEVRLVELPMSPVFNRSTAGRDEVLEELEALVRVSEGTLFHSFNDGVLGLEREDWFGLNHLNATGAVKVSEALGGWLGEEVKGAL